MQQVAQSVSEGQTHNCTRKQESVYVCVVKFRMILPKDILSEAVENSFHIRYCILEGKCTNQRDLNLNSATAEHLASSPHPTLFYGQKCRETENMVRGRGVIWNKGLRVKLWLYCMYLKQEAVLDVLNVFSVQL